MLNKIAYSISSGTLADEIDKLSGSHNTPAYSLINLLVQIRHKDPDNDKIKKLEKSFETDKNIWAGKTL
jgi:hypothetical protein